MKKATVKKVRKPMSSASFEIKKQILGKFYEVAHLKGTKIIFHYYWKDSRIYEASIHYGDILKIIKLGHTAKKKK